MHTLSLVIEDRDEYGDLRAYHKHEVTNPGAIVQFCHYILRSVDDTDMANAAGALLDLHPEAYKEFKRVSEEWMRIEARRYEAQVRSVELVRRR
jgi:hypothetical protein